MLVPHHGTMMLVLLPGTMGTMLAVSTRQEAMMVMV